MATVSITVNARPTTCPTGKPTLDVGVSADQQTASTRFTAPRFTTSGPNELILAFVAADGPTSQTQTVRTVTGGGLTWTLAARSNLTWGTAEVWQAYATTKLTNATVSATLAKSFDGSITVAAFRGAANHVGATTAGAGTTGSPTATLVPAGCNSLVWAAGHVWRQDRAPVPPAGESLVHTFLDRRVHDTFWTQKVDAPTVAGTPVVVSDSGPTGRWGLAVVEIPGA